MSHSYVGILGFGVSGCTALVLMDSAKIQKGNRVLVIVASGDVGSIVVQFAKLWVRRDSSGDLFRR